MQIRTEKQSGNVITAISGAIDAISCSELEDSLFKLIDQGEMHFILNFNDVPYISSAGLRVLLAAAKKLQGKGSISLCHLQSNVYDIFELSGFTTFMNIYKDLATAQSTAS
ncbi:MAG: STAS domain-containing protein [Desulfobacterales bacterium]|nr:STAS domain-containing protein [Desulfobacterales bacterium]